MGNLITFYFEVAPIVGNGIVVLPRVVNKEAFCNAQKVSLSRIPGKCFYGLDNLEAHDYHAPPFHSLGEATDYIKRVSGDIIKSAAYITNTNIY